MSGKPGGERVPSVPAPNVPNEATEPFPKIESLMLYYILGAIVAIVVLFVIVVAMRPNDFVVTRSAKMFAAPVAPYAEINDFRRWLPWSPWEKLDPNLQRTYEGPASGVGSIYRWVGNGNVGQGNMTITESVPGERIRIRLEFIKPFAGVNDTLFTFAPEGTQTLVTWTMSGKYNFITKAMGLFMSMDKMMGKWFDEGLAGIKAIVEGNAK
jgi:hypothetical protein